MEQQITFRKGMGPRRGFHTFALRFEGVARKQAVRPRHPVGISEGR